MGRTTTSPSTSRRPAASASRCRSRRRKARTTSFRGFVTPDGYRHRVAKARTQYRCSECRHVTAKWVGRCLECGTWGTVDEVAMLTAVGGLSRRSGAGASQAVPISSVDANRTQPRPTGVEELDRVLGGGVVPGSVTLLAGEPGV